MRTVSRTMVLAGVLASCGVDDVDGVAPIMETTGESDLEVSGGWPWPNYCPRQTPLPVEINHWELAYAGSAVAIYHGMDCDLVWDGRCVEGDVVAVVQMVDFNAGAKMRVISQVAAGAIAGQPDTELVKRPVVEWYGWTKDHVDTPSNERLFSVTNGSFFMCIRWWDAGCITSSDFSTMSFPQKASNILTSAGAETEKYIFSDGTSAKQLFSLSSPSDSLPQVASIGTYDHAGQTDAETVKEELAPFFEATVGLHPIYGCEKTQDNRTFIGTRNSYAYLLTSVQPVTIVQARDILVDNFGAQGTMQLDSGGSTQFYACDSDCEGASEFYEDFFFTPEFQHPFGRPVPEVLAVYDAP